MTTTIPVAVGEIEVWKLRCRTCGTDFPVGSLTALADHTSRVHARTPSVIERVPLDVVAHLRTTTPPAGCTLDELLDHIAAGTLTLHIDDTGRRWAILLTRPLYGFTRIDDTWYAGYPPATPCKPVPAAARMWLDGWDANHPSPDHTPPQGVRRPVLVGAR